MFNSGMRESWEAEVAIPEGTSYSVFLLLLVWLYTDSLAPEEVSPEMVRALSRGVLAYVGLWIDWPGRRILCFDGRVAWVLTKPHGCNL